MESNSTDIYNIKISTPKKIVRYTNGDEDFTKYIDEGSIPISSANSCTSTIIYPKNQSELIINNNFHLQFLSPKPNRFHRFFQKLLLGWEWRDIV